MKTIGILGGMGPQATVSLFQKIIDRKQALCDQEHIPLLIDNNTAIPDRTDYILGKGINPRPEIIRSAVRLENAGADLLIMPCNTAHVFYLDVVGKITTIMRALRNAMKKGLRESTVSFVVLLEG